MKQNIHPTWYNDCVVTCSCGNTFTTGATSQTIQVDICSACHPFFTGEMRFVDRQGRVDKFMQKMKAAQAKQVNLTKHSTAKAKKQANQEDTQEQKSYQEILREQQNQLRQAGNKKSQSVKSDSSN